MTLGFNKICDLIDFEEPELVAVMREIAAHKLAHLDPGFPAGSEHRKDWEVAMAVRSLDQFGALRPDAKILGVAAGTEDTIFYLTRRAGMVFATDRYLLPGDWAPLAPPLMLVEPGALAPYDFDPSRLVVQHMDGRDLRYPDDTFDGIFSSGSIEHFGGLADVAMAAYEMGRVLKPGGVLALSTEFCLSGPPGGIGWPGLTLVFDEANLRRYVIEASGLELVDDLVLSASDATYAAPRDPGLAVARAMRQVELPGTGPDTPDCALWEFPHVVLVQGGYVWCSVHLTLRKGEGYPATDNAWARPTESTLAAIREYNHRVAVTRAADAPPAAANGAAAAAGASEPAPAPPPGLPPLLGSWDEIREATVARAVRLTEMDAALDTELAAQPGRVAALLETMHEVDLARDEVGMFLGLLPQSYQRLDARLAEPDLVATSIGGVSSATWTSHTVAVSDDIEFVVVIDQQTGDPVANAATVGQLDQFLVRLMLQLVEPGDRVIDLGAHVGTFSLAAAAKGCTVMAVEASPVNAALLRSSVARNGFHLAYVVNVAVSDAPGTVEFFAHGPWGHVVWETGGRYDTVQVPAVTLDALVEEMGFDTVAFVKIDVEGSEIRTLAGMKGLLGRPDAPPILYESNGHTLALAGATPEQLVAAIEAEGYTSYLVEPAPGGTGRMTRVTTGEMQPQTIADYLAVKRRPPGLGDWAVVAGMSDAERVARVLVDLRHTNPHHKIYIAGALRRFVDFVTAHSEVAAALDALHHDPEPGVRDAVRWWPPDTGESRP